MAIVFKDFSRDVSVTPAVQLGVMPRVLFVISVMANLRMSESKSTPNIFLWGSVGSDACGLVGSDAKGFVCDISDSKS